MNVSLPVRNKCLSLNKENITQEITIFLNYGYVQSKTARHESWQDKEKNDKYRSIIHPDIVDIINQF